MWSHFVKSSPFSLIVKSWAEETYLKADKHIILQIYVEIERARLTRKLAKIKEEEGKVKEAAEILQEVAVVCLNIQRN